MENENLENVKVKEAQKDKIKFPHYSHWLRFFLILVAIGLAIGNVFLIKMFWIVDGLGSLSKESLTSITQIQILPWFVVEYILIGLIFVCLCAWIKKGFKNLKSFKEEGLIAGLIAGLIIGLIFGLIIGLTVGLIAGLIGGLIGGLTEEFK